MQGVLDFQSGLGNIFGPLFGSSFPTSTPFASILGLPKSRGQPVSGLYQNLLKPGLRDEFWEAQLSGLSRIAEERTGITDSYPGLVDLWKRNFKRRSLKESEPYPPTDWPDYP